MELFGLGSASEMETPLGKMVKSATDPLLLGPDWSKNLEICDSISSPGDGAEVVKAIFHQLKSSDPKVVQLAITLTDTCIQNSWKYIPHAINKTFMNEMVSISRGRKGFQNQEESLRLIQVWGRRFENKTSELPIFFETYMSMRSQGVNFPPEEEVPVPQPSVQSRKKGKNESSIPSDTEVSKSDKLVADLNVVLEKIRLCREMLPESPGIASDEALSEVIGFLEACQDRMMELIEAGTQGLLSEELFEDCLRVNDALTRTLDAEKDGLTIAVDDGTTPIGQKESDGDAKAGGKGLTTSLLDDETDEFANLTLKTSTKKAGSSGTKKIPTIKGPKESGQQKSSGILLPPPKAQTTPQPQQQQQQALPYQQAGGLNTADFDILSGSYNSASINNQAPPPPQPSNNPFDTEKDTIQNNLPPPDNNHNPLLSGATKNDGVLDIFATTSTPSTLGSSQMTDAEFEDFLNSK